jgi:hypothetical protein
LYSFNNPGNNDICPFCKAEGVDGKTDEEGVEELLERAEVNDAHSIYVLGRFYQNGKG